MFREKENGFVIIMIKILGMFQYTGLFGRIICEIQLLNFSKKQNTNGFLRVLWFEFPFCHTIWFLAEKEKLFTTQPNDGKSINSNIFFLNLYGHTHTHMHSLSLYPGLKNPSAVVFSVVQTRTRHKAVATICFKAAL